MARITKTEAKYGLLSVTLYTDGESCIFQTIDDAVLFIERNFQGAQYTQPTSGIYCMSCFVENIEINLMFGKKYEKAYFAKAKLSIFNFGKKAAIKCECRSDEYGSHNFFLSNDDVRFINNETYKVLSSADSM
jgi:hypothetical protein